MMKKDLQYYISLPYEEIIETDPNGGFVGYIKELPGCITQAETKNELYNMLNDAKRCWIEAALEDGLLIPEPLSINKPATDFMCMYQNP